MKKAEGMYLFAKEITKTTYDFWNGDIFTTVIGKEGVNQRHGHWTWWFKDGGKQMEGEFEQDKPVGKHVWWYSNGQKQAEGEFDAGLETGKWTWWHANGQKMTEGAVRQRRSERPLDPLERRWAWSMESRDYDKVQLVAEEPRVPRRRFRREPSTPPSDRSTMRQPRPLRIESARRNPPIHADEPDEALGPSNPAATWRRDQDGRVPQACSPRSDAPCADIPPVPMRCSVCVQQPVAPGWRL